MKFANEAAGIFVPGGGEALPALASTTYLCIGAHADDIEIMAYGAIAECYNVPDRAFTGVTVTDGGGSPRAGVYAHLTDGEMKKLRAAEQNNAAQIGRYAAQVNLAWASAAVKDTANRTPTDELKQIILTAAPRVVYTHNLADKHDTHVAVALRVIRALRELVADKQLPASPCLIGMEVWRGLDWLCEGDKVIQDAGAFPHLSAALLGVYDSQISGGKRYDLAVQGRRLANAVFHASHSTDEYTSAAYGMDMTPLIDGTITGEAEYINGLIENFRADVLVRVGKYAL